MSDPDRSSRRPVRREPPPLRRVQVVDRVELSPRMLRLSFEGNDLGLMDPPDPAGSVRLLVPSGSEDLVIPAWNGNEFLLPDGSRPVLRTFTPLRFDRAAGRLDLEIVRHPGGAVSSWAESAGPGADGAISGPARGITIDDSIERFFLFGDETALPAISQLLDTLPSTAAAEVHVEVTVEGARLELPAHPRLDASWHVNAGDTPGRQLVEAVRSRGELTEHDHVWAAGEAASMQIIRTHLFKERGIPRSGATVRGYWKPARP